MSYLALDPETGKILCLEPRALKDAPLGFEVVLSVFKKLFINKRNEKLIRGNVRKTIHMNDSGSKQVPISNTLPYFVFIKRSIYSNIF